jgi:hypothetical protein
MTTRHSPLDRITGIMPDLGCLRVLGIAPRRECSVRRIQRRGLRGWLWLRTRACLLTPLRTLI